VKCAVTGVSFVRIEAICAATFAISGETAAMLVGTSSNMGKGQRVKGN
jgi:hypothetical protein